MLTAGSSAWNLIWILLFGYLFLQSSGVLNRLYVLFHQRKEQEERWKLYRTPIEVRNVPVIAFKTALTSGMICLLSLGIYVTLELTGTRPNGAHPGLMSQGMLWVLYIRNLMLGLHIFLSNRHKEQAYPVKGESRRGDPPETGKARRDQHTSPVAWYPSVDNQREKQLHREALCGVVAVADTSN